MVTKLLVIISQRIQMVSHCCTHKTNETCHTSVRAIRLKKKDQFLIPDSSTSAQISRKIFKKKSREGGDRGHRVGIRDQSFPSGVYIMGPEVVCPF